MWNSNLNVIFKSTSDIIGFRDPTRFRRDLLLADGRVCAPLFSSVGHCFQRSLFANKSAVVFPVLGKIWRFFGRKLVVR